MRKPRRIEAFIRIQKVAKRAISKTKHEDLYRVYVVSDMGIWENPKRPNVLRRVARQTAMGLSRRLGGIDIEEVESIQYNG